MAIATPVSHGVTEKAELSPAPEPRPKAAPRRPQLLRAFRRLVYAMLLLCMGIALLWVLGQWTAYRLSHVVTHQACVKGVVTQVGARLDGRVASWHVQPNEPVRKGQLIAELDNAHLVAAVQEAKAEVRRARSEHEVASLALVHQRSRRDAQLNLAEKKRALAEEQAALAQHSLRRWQRERQRAERISDSRVITASSFDQIKLQEKTASSDVVLAGMREEVAELEIQLAETNVRDLQVDQARVQLLFHNIEIAEAALAAAEADLDSTRIRAPEDGRMISRVAESGASVHVGDPIATICLGDVWLEAWVDEAQIGFLDLGQQVAVQLSAYPEERIVGKVESLGVVSDAEVYEQNLANLAPANLTALEDTRIGVRISLPRDARVELFPGLTASVGIRAPDKAASRTRSSLKYLRELATWQR